MKLSHSVIYGKQGVCLLAAFSSAPSTFITPLADYITPPSRISSRISWWLNQAIASSDLDSLQILISRGTTRTQGTVAFGRRMPLLPPSHTQPYPRFPRAHVLNEPLCTIILDGCSQQIQHGAASSSFRLRTLLDCSRIPDLLDRPAAFHTSAIPSGAGLLIRRRPAP